MASYDTPAEPVRVGTYDAPRDLGGRGTTRWPAIAGIAFAPLFIVGMLLHAPDVPDNDEPIEAWVDWVTDSGNGVLALVSVYLLVLSAIALVVFAWGLARRARLARVDDGPAGLVLPFGALTAGLLAVGSVPVNAGPIGRLFGDEWPDPTDLEVFAQTQTIGYGILLVAMGLAAAAFIASATTALRAELPGWLKVVGYIAALLMLLAVFFLPAIALPIWVLIVGIVFVRR